MNATPIRIANASAFWGDSPLAMAQVLQADELDYITLDYLAELTMSLLARVKSRDPQLGYATDFVDTALAPVLAQIVRRGIRVVTNAGGMNPRVCADAVRRLAAELGVEVRVGVVEGDDVLADVAAHPEFAEQLRGHRLTSANAYLGAFPIASALAAGAQIVITGRCVDSALTLGPLIHEHGLGPGDLDLLAAGSLAGHVLECGTQATGGIFTDWQRVPGRDDLGFPICECAADGTFVVTKPPGTGGLVTVATVAEQVLYEIGDPGAYLLPDVTCDLRAVRLHQVGADRVHVSGARGEAPPATLKVSATYLDGFRAVAQFTHIGADATGRAHAAAAAALERCRRIFAERGLSDFRQIQVEAIGAESIYGPWARSGLVREVALKIGVVHDDRQALEIFGQEAAFLGTAAPPGLAASGFSRPKATPIHRFRTLALSRDEVKPRVEVEGVLLSSPPHSSPPPAGWRAASSHDADELPDEWEHGPAPRAEAPTEGPTRKVALVELALARSGDKGDTANVAVIARRPRYVEVLRRELTAARVAAYFAHLVEGPVERFEVPGIAAFNFVLHAALGGGGAASLRHDPLGKGLAPMLLDLELEVPERLLVAPEAPEVEGALA